MEEDEYLKAKRMCGGHWADQFVVVAVVVVPEGYRVIVYNIRLQLQEDRPISFKMK